MTHPLAPAPYLTVPAASHTPAGLISAHTLLGCLVREVTGPDGQTAIDSDHLLIRLPHTGELLRARLHRISTVGAHRFDGPVEQHDEEAGWIAVELDTLAALIAAELTARTGYGNDEFTGQVRASRDALDDILTSRPAHPQRPTTQPAADYLDSEQGLIAGHARHPAPKWRSGDPGQWRRHSPETRTCFPMHWLAVPEELVHEHAAGGDFDRHAETATLLGPERERVPAGCRPLPVHPWQFRLLSTDPRLGPVLGAALADGAVHDLGQCGAPLHPTASVRTLYQPEADVFLKTSLHVRITNCLRKNASYELAGAVELTRLLTEPFAEVARAHPGFGFLPEPAARSVDLPDRYGSAQARHELLEGLGVIVRAGISGHLSPGERAHLAATLAAGQPDCVGTRTRLADLAEAGGTADPVHWARQWWQRYLALLVPPVLRLWAEYGIVLEPHPQNVLVVVAADGMPTRVLARDLEGTKLLADRHTTTLAGLPSDLAHAVAYDEERGWNRIAYCLFVNHLTEMAGALADLAHGSAPHMCRFEDELWDTLGEAVAHASVELGHPPRLRALLAGVPLPAKANLLVRWARDADRRAGYVPFANPFGTDPTDPNPFGGNR
ncbi:IucA/IucC family protein [Rhodococcus sp. WAY2]|uniref:IucA/IucC family protein n=1 Tax=Rhodococcus sp. WAY2 TaxID=2663121 RepID=UPI00131FAF85|nr:IucA/IucC family protein [Rhodococcus sp. WAY2]QHE72953.1 Siderophore synthetase superfamily, group A [Rhodococcus sp. WAY2]